HIAVTVERLPGEAVIRVTDNGEGIAPEMLPHIFDLFTQAEHSLERNHGGLGIGLTLVKRLVELHGGRIKAHSEGLGKGSEFVVHLPLLKHGAKKTPEPAVVPPADKPRPIRVLVVDDNADAAKSLAMLLQLSKHETQVAH